jgi:preprotein translocase subunit SecD
MDRTLMWRAITILVVVLVCVYGIVGLPKSRAELEENLQKNIKLGLDLRGGSHLILEVQVQDALKVEADLAMEQLKEALRKAGVDYASMDRNDPAAIEEADRIQVNIHGVPDVKTADFRRIVAETSQRWVLTPVNATDYRMNMKPSEIVALKKDTVDRSIQTIEQRINGLGLTEPVVQAYGGADAGYKILVQLPGVDDPARVKDIMQTAAMLEISQVLGGPFASREAALGQNGGVLPLNSKLVQMAPGRGEGDSWYLLNRSPVVTGRDLRNARAGRAELGSWETDFTLNQEAAKRFGRFTEANIGKPLAVVLDNRIRSVATIQNRIEDSGRITNQRSQQESSDLALVLRAGSLPAGIVYIEERSIGPSLGADSIHQGIVAGAVGLAAVVSFMLVYYKRSGVNATLALILNAVMLMAALSYFGAVLTLPGIAGVILTIGIAVDSNVLIFERIREEIRAGKGIPAAIDAGFSKAFLTIIDTHVTTVVSCAFLFMFGTGPVKGFAVTLVIGLISNLFTAVFVSRAIFDWETASQPRMARLSI